MRINYKLLISLITTLLAIAPIALANTFPDVNENHSNQAAIEDLLDRGIIEGYPDGTFKPDQQLNRAELTKIVLESLDLGTSNEGFCFPDVPAGEWYTKYVCQAKKLGIVEGYPNGLFRADQPINRAEASKIIAEASSWQIDQVFSQPYPDTAVNEWYTGYVNHAKNRSFLPFNTTFKPDQAINRAEFSEIFHRILVSEDNNSEVYKPEFSLELTTENNNEPIEDNVEISEKIDLVESETDNSFSYKRNTFDNVILDEVLPNNFFDNEIYLLEGEIISGNYDQIIAFYYEEDSKDDMEIFVAKTNDNKFSIPIYFNQGIGEHYLGIIPGTSGTSKIASINVKTSIPHATITDTSGAKANNLELSYQPDLTTLTYNTSSNLNQITISQNQNSITYINRQNKKEIPLRYIDFADFKPGTISVKIKSSDISDQIDLTNRNNWSDTVTKNFSIINHLYSEVTEDITTTSLPTSFTPNQTVTFSGTTKTALSSKLSIILPNGLTEDINTSQNNISPNSSFSFDYTPTENKTYIIEINDTNGIAAINHPIYPKNSYPLVPDFFDLNTLKLNPGGTINESAEANKILNLVNQERNQLGLQSVDMFDTLSDLARSHNQDMINNKFFSHVNLDGETPNDRRVEFNIEGPVGENIAKTTSTEHGHEGLMRSAIHRANILNPYWTRVGISVLKEASTGYYFVSQQFSTSLSLIAENILNSINNERTSDFTENQNLTETAQLWSERMVTNDFVGVSDGDTTIFNTIPPATGFTSFKAYIVSAGNIEDLVNEFNQNDELKSDTWQNIGIGIDHADNGALKTTIIIGR